MPDSQVDNEEGWCVGVWAVVRERGSRVKCQVISSIQQYQRAVQLTLGFKSSP